MRASGKAVLGILLAVLLLPSLAAAFDTQLVTVQEAILPGQAAIFEVDIRNTQSIPDRYTVSLGESSYILFVEERPGELAPNASGTFRLEISPRSFVNPGTHRIPLTIRSQETAESQDLSPIIFIRDPDRPQVEYVPSIALSVDAPDAVDPREDLTLNIALRNRNNRAYDRDDPLTVAIQSDIFYREYNTQLGPVGDEGEKTSEIRIDLDPYEPPAEHPLTVRVIVANDTVSEQSLQFRTQGYSQIEIVTFKEGSLFKTSTTYRVSNDGNVPDVARIEYDSNALERLFITSTHDYTDADGALVIEQPLASRGEAEIIVTENYRLLVLLILLVIASFIGYFLLRSPVVLAKEAVISGTPEEGVSEIKVRVLVRNRSSKTMRHLRVIDRISGMADIVRQEALGTLKPTKVVKKEGQGTLLRWDLDMLEPFEERLISYRARSPLKLVGDVTLPAVKVKFDVPSGRERTAHSNEVSIARGE